MDSFLRGMTYFLRGMTVYVMYLERPLSVSNLTLSGLSKYITYTLSTKTKGTRIEICKNF